MQHVEAVEAAVAKFAARHTAEEIVLLVEQAGVPSAKVARISDVVANPQLRHRNQIVDVDVPRVGKIPMRGLPIKLSGTPASIRRPPPRIGEHTEEVLAEWAGYVSERIAALRSAGAI